MSREFLTTCPHLAGHAPGKPQSETTLNIALPISAPPLAKGAVLFPVTAGINHPLANSWEDKDLPDRLCTDKANPCPKHKMATSKYSFQGLQLVLIVSPAQTHLKKIVIQRV